MASEKLNSAITAIKSGDNATGSRLLAEILLADPSDETAWIWLATSVDDVEKKKYCLKKALSLHPGYYIYIKALIELDFQTQPLFEDIPPSYLPQKTSSENIILSDEGQSEISAQFVKPVFPLEKSSSPVIYSYRKKSNKMEKFGTLLIALLISSVCVISLIYIFLPDIFKYLFSN